MNSSLNALKKRLRDLKPSKNDGVEEFEVPKPYLAPLWLIAPPKSDAVPWVWGLPSLEAPVSQLCTSDQMAGEYYARLCADIENHPHSHRKLWEFIYIKAAFQHHGILQPGKKVLGFGVGLEPLPAAFAASGTAVVATDAPVDVIADMGWDTTNQHSATLEQLYRPNMLSHEEFNRLVSFEPLDMNAIPDHLRDFDACWSACALEHLGSIDLGLDFIENSLATLKSGGVAVHTTEFNLSSNDETFDMHNLALFRRQDFERLIERLVAKGHKVSPLNLHPGTSEVDEHIDLPPYALPHLKLEVAGYVTTSFGLIVTKDGLTMDAAA